MHAAPTAMRQLGPYWCLLVLPWRLAACRKVTTKIALKMIVLMASDSEWLKCREAALTVPPNRGTMSAGQHQAPMRAGIEQASVTRETTVLRRASRPPGAGASAARRPSSSRSGSRPHAASSAPRACSLVVGCQELHSVISLPSPAVSSSSNGIRRSGAATDAQATVPFAFLANLPYVLSLS